MNDRHIFTDHRMMAAQATNQSNRGYDFRPSDEPHIALRAISECFRIRSLIIFAVMGGVLSLFWIS